MTTHIMYHGNCFDGTASAAVVQHFECDNNKPQGPKGWKYYPMAYNDPLPFEIEAGENVIMVDYSRKRQEVLLMINSGMNVMILDHHKTAIEDLGDLVRDDVLSGVLDKTRSGALIAWNFYFPDEEVPMFIRHVSDRDLWEWKLEGSAEVAAGLSALPHNPLTYSSYLGGFLEDLKEVGKQILKYQELWVPRICEYPHRVELWEKVPTSGTIAPSMVNVIAVETNMWYSEVPQYLLDTHYQYGIAAYFLDKGDVVQWGLRSKDLIDVSKVASWFGGGGHINAAGFTISKEEHDKIWTQRLPITKKEPVSTS